MLSTWILGRMVKVLSESQALQSGRAACDWWRKKTLNSSRFSLSRGLMRPFWWEFRALTVMLSLNIFFHIISLKISILDLNQSLQKRNPCQEDKSRDLWVYKASCSDIGLYGRSQQKQVGSLTCGHILDEDKRCKTWDWIILYSQEGRKWWSAS